MSMLSDDLAAIFADTSLTVSVEFGTSPVQCTTGFLSSEDVPESDGQGGIIIVPRRIVTMLDGALEDLADDLAITVEDAAYRIHGVRSAGRGKVRVILAEDA